MALELNYEETVMTMAALEAFAAKITFDPGPDAPKAIKAMDLVRRVKRKIIDDYTERHDPLGPG